MSDVQRLRKKYGLSQAELATQLGVSQATVSRLEQNDPPEYRQAIAQSVRPSRILEANRDDILKFLNDLGYTNVAVFGSCLSGTDKPGSDIDLFVEDGPSSGFALIDAELDLTERYGVSFDLCLVRPEFALKSGLAEAYRHREYL